MLVFLMLAGCSSDDSDTKGAEGEDNSTQDTLIYGRGADSVSLDPATVTDTESFKVTQQIFDTLIDFEKGTTELRPMLATDWKISNGGKTYTFKLRKDVKFSDGTDFNAEAVVFNFERWMKGNKSDQTFSYYATMFGGFKGDKNHVIKNVKAIDAYTVQFNLNRTFAPFLKNLAMPPFGIGSPTAIKKGGDQFGKTPVGTGPFSLKKWEAKNKIVLKANENYWREGYPKLNRIIFRVIPDNAARLNALKTNEVDMMDGLSPTDLESVNNTEGLHVWYRPPMNVAYMQFNTKRAPFDNKKVRQALSRAINKQALIDAFYAGAASPAKTFLPKTIMGYNDSIESYEFNLEKAKKMLAEAGYEEGFDMELWTMNNPRSYLPEPQKIAQAIQANFKKIGVNVDIRPTDWSTYLDKVHEGVPDAFLLGWIGDNGDPDNFLYNQYAVTGSGPNYTWYKNDKLTKLLTKAQSVTDKNKRIKLYKEAQAIIHQEAPDVPLVHNKEPIVGKSNIKGFKPSPTGTDQLYDVYFE
ncbi:ABC transporter substrate-binding protein [Virgibacillus siamensis]|uniref:ABC transporter substrate-binding protein n=1 Tax=Virgibacillus siamensis TaxID=480071 RepID=UPI0009872926|nr:ABC transporter substrate-binding protein [Virgibacillus siamensis]